MFDRFTVRARKVMGLARQEAQRFSHDYIGTEHMLLGLISEGTGVGASILLALGVDLRKARFAVEKRLRVGTHMVTMGQLPFTPAAKKVLECSLMEASNLGHSYIGSEHLVLGMARQEDGIAALVLKESGVKIEAAREKLLAILAAQPEDVPPEDVQLEDDDEASGTPALNVFGTDLTELAGNGDLDLSGANNQDIQELARTLSRRTMNCVVLVAEGHRERLAVVHGLAQAIGSSALPSYLKNMRIVELDTQMMLAGSKNRGMFEERAQAVLSELKQKRNVVLFIEDLRLLAGGRGARYDADIEFAFQNALLRGEFQCITTATPKIYAACRDEHTFVDAVFRPLSVHALSPRRAIEVLASKLHLLEAHHVVMFARDAAAAAVAAVRKQWPDEANLDRAFQLLDFVAAEARFRAWRESEGGMPEVEIREAQVEAAWPAFLDSLLPPT